VAHVLEHRILQDVDVAVDDVELVRTLEDVVEPYLLYEKFILRTPNGRLATPKAYAQLGMRPPGRKSAQQPLLLEDDSATSAG